ncbi:MAG: hypothetical protein ABEH77_09325 [Halobacteriaceae archaeon]
MDAGTLSGLRAAIGDLIGQEFRWSAGHLSTLLGGCVFAPSILSFWLVNGLLNFPTAVVLGAVGSTGGLFVRLGAYVLLVPVFVALRAGYYLAHPVHRETVLAGACPQSELFSLDWFSAAILLTGFPLAMRELGPWLSMNAVFVLGLFVAPHLLPVRWRLPAKVAGVAGGILVFLYARYWWVLGGLLPPAPALLGPAATLTLSEAAVGWLMDLLNSLLVGPPAVAAVTFVMNRLLTRPELTSIPGFRHALPDRDPWEVVVPSAVLGTVFYLGFQAAVTGRLLLLP